MLAAADPYGDESLSVEMSHGLGARTVRFDDLGHSWMIEDRGWSQRPSRASGPRFPEAARAESGLCCFCADERSSAMTPSAR
jgi:hypothetical protein